MHKFQQVLDSQTAGQERMINFLLDEMEAATGVRVGGGRFPERKAPVIQHTPVTLNTITIDRSVVGTVNTGYINQLELEMSSISQVNQDGADKIKGFAEAVLKEKKLDKAKKEQIIQQLNFLVEQLNVPTTGRNMAVLGSVASTIFGLINFSASLLTLWAPIKTLLNL